MDDRLLRQPAEGASRRPGERPLTLLGIWAHPDDETYLSAVLMHRVVAAGGRVTVVTATRGEHGTDDPLADRAELGARRERELRAAMAHLGVHDVWMLGHEDGACAAADVAAAAAPLALTIRALQPEVIVTFGPDGITNHPDHVAVSRWATQAWLDAGGDRGVAGTLLYATMTDSFVERHDRDYPEVPLTVGGAPRSVPDADVVLRIEPDEHERDRKRSALDAHRSQVAALIDLLGEDRLHRWWLVEHFRLPTPRELEAARAPSAHAHRRRDAEPAAGGRHVELISVAEDQT